MLVDFKVTNFKSFKDTNEFSMEKGKYLRKYKNNILTFDKIKLLKLAILFGGNANGKTNLLDALRMLRFLVLTPTTSENDVLPTNTFGYNSDDTKLSVSFIKGRKYFEYELVYDQAKFQFEKLKVNNSVIFERRGKEFITLPKQLGGLQKNIRKNQNLLFFAQENNVNEAKLAYTWFLEDLVFVNSDQVPNVLFKALSESNFKNKFLKFLKAADFNIIDVEVKERRVLPPKVQIDFNGEMFMPKNEETYATIYDVYTTHHSKDKDFQVHFDNESTGTKAFMFLALYILRNVNAGKVLLIDEFDRSFHLELAEALLDVFTHEKQLNQFILTTHELSLMDHKLRQDQIWFAEKNEYGETELFSIYDFDDISLSRGDFGYKKRYLEGRLGATQIINHSALLEVLGE